MEKKISTKTLAGVAIFTALTFLFGLPVFEIPIFGFLKLGFSNVFVLFCGFMYGPVAAVATSFVKEALCIPIGSTMGVGELANFLTAVSFALVPSLVYRNKQGIKVVLITLPVGCALQILCGLFVNAFLTFPFYNAVMGSGANLNFSDWVLPLVAFNAIKSVSVSALCLLLYKRVSVLFEKMTLKTPRATRTFSFERGVPATVLAKSDRETRAAGEAFAKTLKTGDVVLLVGDLGAGKTTFVKGVAKGLGITDDVTSPTYAYLNVYGDYLYHYDAYRLSSGEDAEALGLTDYFNGDNVCMIEWPSVISSVLPKETRTVEIQKAKKGARVITVR